MTRTAVVLFNLGGPNSLDAVEPFLRELFRDPAIIRLPKFLREPLAWFVAKKRCKKSQAIFASIGGCSPLRENTEAQAKALEALLGEDFRVFTAMRYWHPFIHETVKEVKDFDPERIVLLPLYPQFSTTTTASSLECWKKDAQQQGLHRPTFTVGCYPTHPLFIEALVDLLEKSMVDIEDLSDFHLLFTAHGLPEKIIAQGDPYQKHVEATVLAVMRKLNRNLPYSIGYQSRVGPLKWIGPSAEHEIERLAHEHKNIFLMPIAFVSEHSETLHELDIQYQQLAKRKGVRSWSRIDTVGVHPTFISALADLCQQALVSDGYYCPQSFSNCRSQNLCQGLKNND